MRDWAPIAVPLFATRLRDFQRSNANPLSVVGFKALDAQQAPCYRVLKAVRRIDAKGTGTRYWNGA
jgi:hypothetical protein